MRLPGDAALVVGGRLHNGTAGSTEFTVLERGSAVYGSTRGRPPVLKSGSENTEGEPPVDFAAEFGALRALAAELDALPTRGSVTRTTSGGRTTLTLAGDHPGLNVFPVSGGQLADAGRIVVETPPGATVLVNVSGRSHNLRAAGAHGVSGPRGVAASLLWNFAGATTVEGVPGRAWPGTLLAPDAAVHLGPGGPLRGAVLARSLVAEGTEIQHVPFAGCLDPAAFPPHATSTAPGADLAT
ncbi:choice-of-anchor A family protein, partial [Streptomyces sparsus]